MINRENIGLDLAVIGTIISIMGVIWNNIFLSHYAAMQFWFISNLIFVVYFYGRSKGYWDGNISDSLLCLNYAVMLITGIYGLWFS
jgi:hypothetical protein